MKIDFKRMLIAFIITSLLLTVDSLGLDLPDHLRVLVILFGAIIGLIAVFWSSEWAVVGLRSLVAHLGQTEYTAGVISSLASNAPELVIACLMAIRGLSIGSIELVEISVLTVMIAAGFNMLLLGLLIVIVSWRIGQIEFPYRAIAHESDLIRMTIVTCLLIFALGVIEGCSGFLPREVGLFLIATYVSYLFFMIRSQRVSMRIEPELDFRSTVLCLILSFGLIAIGGELIVSATEYVIHELSFPLILTAMVIGCIGSVPEHGIALVGAHRGHIELGVANLISGISQCVLVVLGVVSLFAPIPLDGYVLFQLASIAASLWIVKKAIMDDNRLTVDEGIFILILQVLLFVMLEELRV